MTGSFEAIGRTEGASLFAVLRTMYLLHFLPRVLGLLP